MQCGCKDFNGLCNDTISDVISLLHNSFKTLAAAIASSEKIFKPGKKLF
jgi:hypothetical protein